jgi:hypothetical protein
LSGAAPKAGLPSGGARRIRVRPRNKNDFIFFWTGVNMVFLLFKEKVSAERPKTLFCV